MNYQINQRRNIMLEKLFKLQENKTTVTREIVAGLVTFMTMAYIIFVNPGILSNAMEGIPIEAIAVATCLAAGIMTICMGIFSNYPLALASGMGLNAVVTFSLVKGMNLSWQVAMGMIFIEGIVIAILVLTNFRVWVMNAIPTDLKRAIGVGIGLFIAFIGFKDAGLIVSNPDTFVALGKIGPGQLIAAFGLLLTIVLMVRKVKGSILIGILTSTVVAIIVTVLNVANIVKFPNEWVLGIKPEYFSTFFAFDVLGALKLALVIPIFTLLISDFFDTMGTIVAVGEEAGYLTADGKVPRLKSALMVDSLAAAVGGAFGCSSVTTYIESASGVGEGGRTGLTAVVTGILFLLAIFIAPIVGIVPAVATAPALIVVGFLMLIVVKVMNWEDMTIAIPAFLTIVTIPLTFSITNGIGIGFISYVIVKALSGKLKDIHPLMYIVALAFGLYFAFL
jgi:AGZA family xanthine/uracil permease-like MFS transporter